MNLIKTSYYTFIATVIKMISALVINKAIAFFIGPSGLALIGQFQNFTQLAMTAAQGAINTGVVKYSSEHQNDENKLNSLFSTSIIISVTCSIITGLIIIIFSKYASLKFLDTIDYNYVFIVFGLTIILFSLNSLLISILNGLNEIKIFVKVNIIQSIYSLIFTTILVVFWGTKGALLALATNQSLIFFILLYILRKHPILKIKNFKKAYDSQISKNLFKFSLMAIISAVINPISLIIIRNLISNKYSIETAGQWQALWYISTTYLLVVTTTLSVYYLPKLSSITETSLLRKEIFQGYKIITPIVLLSVFAIYFSKDIIIKILFTQEFLVIKNLFLFQLIGDFLKLLAWLLSYIMLAKSMTKTFIVTEVIFVSTFVIFSYLFINKYGLIGVTYAFALNYFLYLICMILIFWRLLFSKLEVFDK